MSVSVFRRRASCAILVVLVSMVATVTPATAAPRDLFGAATNVVADAIPGGGAVVRWSGTAPAYRVQGFDLSALLLAPPVTQDCQACTSVQFSGLTVGHVYVFVVWSFGPFGLPIGVAAVSNQMTPAVMPPPSAMSSVTLSQNPGDQALTASWTYAETGPPADTAVVRAYAITGTGAWYFVGSAWVRRDQMQSVTIPALEAHWVVQVEAANGGGSSHPVTSNVVRVTNPCSRASLCASVTPSDISRPVGSTAQGFFNGVTTFGHDPIVDPTLMAPLQPQQWRVGTKEDAVLAAGLGATTTQVLSGVWMGATGGADGRAAAPWQDWNAYRTVISNYVATAIAEGWAPEYWDVWNEPDINCCPYFSDIDWANATTDRILETFKVTYEAVRAVDPDAKLIGPSLAALSWYPQSGVRLDLDTFLRYSQANGLRWAAVSWHENNPAPNPSQGDVVLSTSGIADHVAAVRRLLSRYPGVVDENRIIVNEYTNHWNHLIAGWNVGYISALEEAGVAQANRSCWDSFECFGWPVPPGMSPETARPSPGGILGDGTQTRPLWWVLKAYADMQGQSRMALSTSASWQFDGLATRDDAASTVRVLLGRHAGCDPDATLLPDGTSVCPGGWFLPASDAVVTIAWPYGNDSVHLTVSRMPADVTPIDAPSLVADFVASPTGGTVTVPIAAVADGDAYSIVATRVPR